VGGVLFGGKAHALKEMQLAQVAGEGAFEGGLVAQQEVEVVGAAAKGVEKIGTRVFLLAGGEPAEQKIRLDAGDATETPAADGHEDDQVHFGLRGG